MEHASRVDPAIAQHDDHPCTSRVFLKGIDNCRSCAAARHGILGHQLLLVIPVTPSWLNAKSATGSGHATPGAAHTFIMQDGCYK